MKINDSRLLRFESEDLIVRSDIGDRLPPNCKCFEVRARFSVWVDSAVVEDEIRIRQELVSDRRLYLEFSQEVLPIGDSLAARNELLRQTPRQAGKKEQVPFLMDH